MGVWAYSVDLRERVVRAFEVGEMTDHEVAALFGIGEATVHRWKRRHRETGSLDPLPHKSGNPPRVTPEQRQLVQQIVKEESDLTIPEVAEEFWRRSGTKVSCSAMGRTLRQLGLTRKKRA
ncbi:MAG TPA: transposase [Anaeromyxobacter sp.]